MTAGRRSWWGWGTVDQAFAPARTQALGERLAQLFGVGALRRLEPPQLKDLALGQPRVTAPSALDPICSADPHDRAGHSYGKAYRDVVRALRGQMDHVPDLVAFPRHEADVAALLDWCSEDSVAAVPYGGGSSVVGGVECEVGPEYRGAVSIDLGKLSSVVEIDRLSRSACIEAGVYGPDLEDLLRPHGLTLRHFPQSFEFSTLGGWLATRSGGHFATGPTHIDDFVASIRMLTPRGVFESRRLPGSGAGPSPDRLLLGSEGSLGVITRAWMRLQDRPVFRAGAVLRFADYQAGAAAVRHIAQGGLLPANCRYLDAPEAMISAGSDGSHHLLILACESADHPVAEQLDRCVTLGQDHGGVLQERHERSEAESTPSVTEPNEGSDVSTEPKERSAASTDRWRSSFLSAPYARDAMATLSLIVETFETACPWSAFENLRTEVTSSVQAALREVCGSGVVTCRFTHVYPDGPAPYFSVFAPGRRGSELEQWDEIKAAASEAIISAGGTITHHHAIGRVHRPWNERQRPPLFGEAFQATKGVLDPAGIMNPGVLVDPANR